jgi:hypothetical protein
MEKAHDEISRSAFGGLDHLKDAYIVPPRQLCNNLLHKLFVRVSFSKGPHILQVSRPKTIVAVISSVM